MPNLFPQSANRLPFLLLIGAVILGATTVVAVTYYYTPKYTRVGYAPEQPVPFSHRLHVDQLGMDCLYCHTHVSQSGHSNIPGANVCMSCHSIVQANSPLLEPVRQAYSGAADAPAVEWVRIHKLPDYVYFNHAVHVNRGVSCVHCHGEIQTMDVVHHAEELSMGWCLECHRAPEAFIRPVDEVYNLDWEPENVEAHKAWAREAVLDWNIIPPQSCSGCHR